MERQIEYNEDDIVRLFKEKRLSPEQIAKVYRIDHNVIKRILLDRGYKLEGLTDLIGTHDDYVVHHKHRPVIIGSVAMLLVAVFIGYLSYTQEGTLFGRNQVTGFVVSENPTPAQLPPCPYECCSDEYHELKSCGAEQVCRKSHCYSPEDVPKQY